MATGLFVGLPEDEILRIRRLAQSVAGEVKTIINYANQGTSVGKTITAKPAEIVDECMYALKKLNPGLYGNVRDGRRVSANFGRAAHRL